MVGRIVSWKCYFERVGIIFVYVGIMCVEVRVGVCEWGGMMEGELWEKY